ncbi:MAG: caspase family protein, partial [Bacteroidales bacterium]|nr:caspase family protein [Bacteroidales bacterium]
TKIFETNKQISIKGKATDNSGIYEVLINGLDANLDKYGNFEQNVNLAIGENQITVKATDIKNNSSYYKFYVNRQSNVIVQTNENIKTENEKRLALVIGNSNYGAGQTLKNPANDANLISTTLQSLGFEVIKRIDANKQSMEEAIRDFSKKLPNCNVALFYYAGHGVQVDGLNYIIPTDAKLNDKIDCKFEAVSINFIVEEFEHYPDNVNIVILDACRNNPFRSWARGGERGFRAISPTSGTIISFATSEGSTASDGKGNNGLFTEELVKQLVIPQAIESVFKKTRVQVQKRSNGSQSPQEWSQLTGDFYFKK